MAKIDKNYKKLFKVYNKKLKKLHLQAFNKMTPPIEYFSTYLQFLRDMKLLSRPFAEKLGENQVDLASLITANLEFKAFNDCINNYYTIVDGVAQRKPEYTEEEAQKKCQEELTYHWETFWDLVKLCMEDWAVDV